MDGWLTTWAAGAAVSLTIAAAYFSISYLIAGGLIRTRQVRRNRLGVATALIFFSCGFGHLLHAEHLILHEPTRHVWDWHIVLWDAFTAAVAINFLLLRRQYGRLLLADSPLMFDDQERRAFEERLRFAAYHDETTQLPNRAAFAEQLERALEQARRSGRNAAVLLLDVDRFKHVNDSFGHHAGDELLRVISRRITDCLRPTDCVARLGGDEFVVLLEGVADLERVTRVAQRMLDRLREPVTVQDREVTTSASIGIVLSTPGSDETGSELLRKADIAMYQAKAGGKDRFAIFHWEMSVGLKERLQLQADMKRAVERGEIVAHFQPIVELDTGRLVGFEALARWLHPRGDVIPPADFLPIAEESAAIRSLGDRIFDEAFAQAAGWPRGERLFDLWVSMNLSAAQLQDEELPARFARMLHQWGLAPERVVAEITETAVMRDPERCRATLDELRLLGVRIALDDLGTGYSSLTHVTQLPLDMIKIDRAFVRDLLTSANSQAVVRALVQLAYALDIEVVAEGIETAGQAAALRRLGVQLGQGFYFGRPVAGRYAGETAERPGPLAVVH